jgi:hypothetical protein
MLGTLAHTISLSTLSMYGATFPSFSISYLLTGSTG